MDAADLTTSETHMNFLDLQPRDTGVRARCRVLPLPYEATVSYEGGTSRAPECILKASAQVELYDRAIGSEGCMHYGIQTLPAYSPEGQVGKDYVDGLTAYTEQLFEPGRLVVGLGGEHTVTVGLVRGTRQALGKPLTMVQIDAHADLRNQYGGDPYSHASISRRALEDGVEKLILIGTRSVCPEEVQLIEDDSRIHVFWADQIQADASGNYLRQLSELIQGQDVYLTIDVDGLDPSVVPATGTPEPGGLSWWQACSVIRTTAEGSNIRGMDVTELAPRQHLHAADFATAKLTYFSINQIAKARGWLD